MDADTNVLSQQSASAVSKLFPYIENLKDKLVKVEINNDNPLAENPNGELDRGIAYKIIDNDLFLLIPDSFYNDMEGEDKLPDDQLPKLCNILGYVPEYIHCYTEFKEKF